MKKHITIGVVGHTHHGKTSLIQWLTGRDFAQKAPALKPNLSFDAGIVHFQLTSDITVAFIDVPGSGNFVKNTVRGLCAADLCVLVVDAADGVMPQTVECIKIIDYLKIPHGLIALSKSDLVDDELLEYAELEVKDAVEHTVLSGKSIVSFSVADERARDPLLSCLISIIEKIPGKNSQAPFRLWIDHVTTVAGFGTVVCGTVISGVICQDDPVCIVPLMAETKARTIEVNHRKVAAAVAGQRAGISLPRISFKQIRRGMALVKKDTITPGLFLNTQITATKLLKNRQRVRLHLGTSVSNVGMVLMDKPHLTPGDSILAQFRLQKPLIALPSDPVIISQLDTQKVIGGGVVLETTNLKYRAARAQQVIAYLEARRANNMEKTIECYLRCNSNRLIPSRKIADHTGFTVQEIIAKLEQPIKKEEITVCDGDKLILNEVYEKAKEKVRQSIKNMLSKDPLKKSINKEEIRHQFHKGMDDSLLQCVLSDLCANGGIIKCESGYMIPDFMASLTSEQEKTARILLSYAKEMGMNTFSAGGFCYHMRGNFKKNEIQKILEYLNRQGKLIHLKDNTFLNADVLDEIKCRVEKSIVEKGSIRPADSIEILGYGRTRGIAVLEYLDDIGFTCRQGDVRTLKRL
jgi:selenocysteine-specific elongation factor